MYNCLRLPENTLTRSPYYELSLIKSLLDKSQTRHITRESYRAAVSLGYAGEEEIIAVVKNLRPEDFHKTMESTDFPGLWQDVYKPEDKGLRLYIKLQIWDNGKGVVIQFKRK